MLYENRKHSIKEIIFYSFLKLFLNCIFLIQNKLIYSVKNRKYIISMSKVIVIYLDFN